MIKGGLYYDGKIHCVFLGLSGSHFIAHANISARVRFSAVQTHRREDTEPGAFAGREEVAMMGMRMVGQPNSAEKCVERACPRAVKHHG